MEQRKKQMLKVILLPELLCHAKGTEMAEIFQNAPRGLDVQDPIFQTQSISSAEPGN